MKDYFKICPNCGSTEYLENYPVKRRKICIRCGCKIVDINLTTIKTEQEILDQCPSCGKEGEEDDTLFEEGDVIVFKCKKCGKLDGYRFFPFGEVYDDGTSDSSYDSLSVKIAEQEGKSVYSAGRSREYAEALRKKGVEYAPIEKCKRQLNALITNRANEMNKAGASPETIKIVRREVQGFLEREGAVTQKQLATIFAAALSLVQKSDQIYYRKSLGKRVTDCQLEKIFNVTRKTIRKWRKTLHSASLFWCKLRVKFLIHKVEETTEYTIIQVPEEVESLIKLEKPRKDKCDCCQKSKVLCTRLRFVDGSRSDTCERCATSIEPFLRESQINQE